MLYCMLSKKDESIRPSLVLFFYLSPREEGRIVKDTLNDNHLYRRFLLSTAPANMLVLFSSKEQTSASRKKLSQVFPKSLIFAM